MIQVLGLFDSECNLIDFNDDAFDLNSRLLFTVPDSGVFILATASFPISNFLAAGLAITK